LTLKIDEVELGEVTASEDKTSMRAQNHHSSNDIVNSNMVKDDSDL
jgi:hypothetical protein